MKKFLYAFFLNIYRIVGWFVRKVKPKQELKTHDVSSNNSKMIVDGYELKRKFRWVLDIGDGFIPSHMVKWTHRPVANANNNRLKVSFYDSVFPSMSHKFYKWINEPECKNATLKLFDSDGNIVEEWRYTHLIPELTDFGSLDYKESEPCEIFIEFSYGSVELLDRSDS